MQYDYQEPLLVHQFHHGRSPTETVGLHFGANFQVFLAVSIIVPLDSATNALFKRHRGLVSKELVGLGHISASVGNIGESDSCDFPEYQGQLDKLLQ